MNTRLEREFKEKGFRFKGGDRDARYSMSPEYSPPDADGVRNMFLVHAVVGEVCKGV